MNVCCPTKDGLPFVTYFNVRAVVTVDDRHVIIRSDGGWSWAFGKIDVDFSSASDIVPLNTQEKK